ncbi:polyubiquitin-like [Hippoglossus stenolepis]|uniref:polyubiquitin-like n=1 Tax=Hippoglossus stenolepis TaxID=195615 RepID=UPI001FB0274F|nr:polyubiquitin-like [Hippoglossus stenolepis]
MDLIITMMNGKTVTLRVNPQDTVGSLKQVLQQKMEVPVHGQRLVFDNGQRTDLSDDLRTVGSYGLHAGSRLSLLVIEPSPPSPPATFQVLLRNEKNVLTPYDITSDETVSDFKRRVQCKEGVAVTQQRLVYQSREMTSGKLSDYNVQGLSTIELLMRLRGGN